jgi:hypothetical protein
VDKVKFMMNLDMTNNVYGMSVGGRDELIPFFQSVGEQIKKVDGNYANAVSSRAGLHSDHQPFMLEGIPNGRTCGASRPQCVWLLPRQLRQFQPRQSGRNGQWRAILGDASLCSRQCWMTYLPRNSTATKPAICLSPKVLKRN